MAEPSQAARDAAGAFAPTEWDQIIVEGEALPGFAVVRVNGKLKVDPGKAAGKHGGSPTFQGQDPAQVDITLTVLREDVPKLLKRIEPLWPKDAERKAAKHPIAVYHPNLAALGVKSIYFTDRSGLDKGPATGSFVMTLKAVEFRLAKKNAKPATRKPKSSYGNTIAPKGGQSVQPDNANATLPSGDAKYTAPR